MRWNKGLSKRLIIKYSNGSTEIKQWKTPENTIREICGSVKKKKTKKTPYVIEFRRKRREGKA